MTSEREEEALREFGLRLMLMRRRLRLSQEQVSERSDPPVSVEAIGQVERGKYRGGPGPGVLTIGRILRAMGYTWSDLVSEKGSRADILYSQLLPPSLRESILASSETRRNPPDNIRVGNLSTG